MKLEKREHNLRETYIVPTHVQQFLDYIADPTTECGFVGLSNPSHTHTINYSSSDMTWSTPTIATQDQVDDLLNRLNALEENFYKHMAVEEKTPARAIIEIYDHY